MVNFRIVRNLIRYWVLAAVVSLALPLSAQIFEPVKFRAELREATSEIVFSGTIEDGWHVYSTNIGDDGPTEASFHAETLEGIELVGTLTPVGKEITEYDEMFGMTLRYFEQKVQFVQKIKFTAPKYSIDCYLEYGACSSESCIPPSVVTLKRQGNVSPEGDGNVSPCGDGDVSPCGDGDVSSDDDGEVSPEGDGDISPEVDDDVFASGNDISLWLIFIMGFAGGFVALLTPCVWPIIPMTVSFFLKRAKDDRKKGIKDAVTYGISIVVIYVTLGLAVTALFGASTLNALSTSAVFNLLFFALLVVFALSFFGWFEIKLPEKWGNAVDSKASATSGLLSIFLMAFTLSLVSFSCTGPIIGFLLVEMTSSGSILGPAVGMLGFAIALALPFTLFALFPSWLKSAPRSGSWMTTIKVTLGFIELAFALKFLSVADLAYGWHILDREVFLCLWIVIFGLLGMYLIGKLKFQSDAIGGELDKPMPVPCIMLGLLSLAFALYMVPGLWGAPCKAVSAFAPPMNTQDFNLYDSEVEAQYTDYELGMAAAKQAHKPVFVDFTGFGCVNCRKMEAAVWTDPKVASTLQNDYILISRFVDDKPPLPEPIKDTENGEERTLKTVGDKNSYLQRSRFHANAQPFYVILNNQGESLNGSFAYKEDVSAFQQFLNDGLKKYHSAN